MTTSIETGGGTPGSLYDRLGGKDAVDSFSGRFFQLVLGDEELKHRFTDVNMDTHTHNFGLILRAATGSQDEEALTVAPVVTVYLRRAHEGLGIIRQEYIRTAYYVGVVAGELGIQQPELGELIDLVLQVEPAVAPSAVIPPAN